MSRKQLVPNNIYTAYVEPTAHEGDVYFDKTLNRLRIYFDNSWSDLAYVTDLSTTSNAIFGGYYDTQLFADSIDGMYYNTDPFDVIIDGGALV